MVGQRHMRVAPCRQYQHWRYANAKRRCMEMEHVFSHNQETSEISVADVTKGNTVTSRHITNARETFLQTHDNCHTLTLESIHLKDNDLSILQDMYQDHVQSLQDEAKQLTSLEVISCSFHNEQSVQRLVEFLKDLEHLKDLALEDIQYGSFTDKPILTQVLTELNHQEIRLKRLSIRQMHILGCGRNLTELLSCNEEVMIDLIFHRCHFDAVSFEGLARGLLHHKNGLKKLELMYSMTSTHEFEALVQTILLSSTRRSLREFSISDSKPTVWNVLNNPLSGSLAFSSISALIQHCTSVSSLNLGDCRDLFENVKEDTKSYTKFLRALQENTALQVLNMRGCCITDKLAEPFFQALEKNSALQELHLECGPSPIMESLIKSLPHLHVSILGANVDLENRRFQKALYQNMSLVQIDVGHNRAFAGREIIGVLQRNWQLQNVIPRLLGDIVITPTAWPHFARRLCEDHSQDPTTVYALLQSTSAQVMAWREQS